jgi:hypothetical protein
MTLAAKSWAKISFHEVVAAFLKAERDSNFNFFPAWLPVIDHPHLDDPRENHMRARQPGSQLSAALERCATAGPSGHPAQPRYRRNLVGPGALGPDPILVQGR